MALSRASIEKVDVSAYKIPTDAPEGDGTLQWDSTTLIVCEIYAGGERGLGYTYGNKAAAIVVEGLADRCLVHRSPLDIPALNTCMQKQVRNDGSRGIAALAISALDVALWDLKSKLFDRSVADMLGCTQQGVAVYGSGGFTETMGSLIRVDREFRFERVLLSIRRYFLRIRFASDSA